jgi:hypothetical protein
VAPHLAPLPFLRSDRYPKKEGKKKKQKKKKHFFSKKVSPEQGG